MELKLFLKPMSKADREDFALRCETSVGHLNNVAYGVKPCSAELAIRVDRESAGVVTCEELCPDVDWKYLRDSSSPTSLSMTSSR